MDIQCPYNVKKYIPKGLYADMYVRLASHNKRISSLVGPPDAPAPPPRHRRAGSRYKHVGACTIHLLLAFCFGHACSEQDMLNHVYHSHHHFLNASIFQTNSVSEHVWLKLFDCLTQSIIKCKHCTMVFDINVGQQFYIDILDHIMKYFYWFFHYKNFN